MMVRSLHLLHWMIIVSLLLATGCTSLLQAAARSGELIQANRQNPAVKLQPMPTPTSTVTDEQAEQLLTLLRFVPNRPAYRQWLTYGDAAAWYRSEQIAPLQRVADLDLLDEEARQQWLYTMALQTTPPAALGVQSLATEDLRELFGFSFFDAQRYLEAGMPIDEITVSVVDLDAPTMAQRLLTMGYTATEVDASIADLTGTRYAMGEDYAINMRAQSYTAKLARLNRIALLVVRGGEEQYLLTARATAIIDLALSAWPGYTAPLAADPNYRAAVQALFDPALAETGELVGVIFLGEPNFSDPAAILLGDRASPEQIAALKERFAGEKQLPPIRVAAFATRRTTETTSLLLALVLPRTAATEEAATILAASLQNYTSVVTGQPLSERWTVEAVLPLTVNDVPVVVANLQLKTDNPQQRPLTWFSLVAQRDLLFLVTE